MQHQKNEESRSKVKAQKNKPLYSHFLHKSTVNMHQSLNKVQRQVQHNETSIRCLNGKTHRWHTSSHPTIQRHVRKLRLPPASILRNVLKPGLPPASILRQVLEPRLPPASIQRNVLKPRLPSSSIQRKVLKPHLPSCSITHYYSQRTIYHWIHTSPLVRGCILTSRV